MFLGLAETSLSDKNLDIDLEMTSLPLLMASILFFYW